MNLNLYKLVSSIFFLCCLSVSSLYAQPTVTSVDGNAASPCFNTTPVVTVSESNLTLDIVLDIAGNPPPGAFLQIQHKYSNTIPGGPISTSNNAQFFDPMPCVPGGDESGCLANGTYSFTVNLNSSVFDGDGFTHNFIQFILWTDGFGEQLGECRVFFTLDAPMPVELTSFQGKVTQKTNTIKWQTASEVNNEYFEIERSIDGKNFETIGMAEGNGTTNISSNYQFVDRLPSTMSYYRLRQVDFDGAFEYSDVITIEREDRGGDDFIVYPIPAKDKLNIEYSASQVEEMTISVVSITGKVLTNQTVTNQEGRNLFNINSANLPAGTYILRIDAGHIQMSKLFTK